MTLKVLPSNVAELPSLLILTVAKPAVALKVLSEKTESA